MKLSVDKTASIPVQEQIYGQIVVLIRLRKLLPNTHLPTVKELASSLNLNYNTVAAAYRALEKRGYVVQNRRAGTRVASSLPEDTETELLAQRTVAMAEQLRTLSDDTQLAMSLLAANLALQSLKTPLKVAVLARTPLAAARAAARSQTILGDGYTCIPQTPAECRSSDYHLTIIDSELIELFTALPRSAPPPYSEVHSAAFPAGAD